MIPTAAAPFHDVPVFGDYDPHRPWLDRPCVYGIAFDAAGCLLVVDRLGERLLPGGGIDPGETDVDALAREALEETGHQIEIGARLGRARHYYDPRDELPPRHKLCRFFRIWVGPAAGPPLEPEHLPRWLPLDEALATLTHAVDRWAVLRQGSPGGNELRRDVRA